MDKEHENPHTRHGDRRVEELREKYGDMADMTTDELKQRAQRQGIKEPWSKGKEELLRALSG
ncbi:hypothetical protein ACFSJS_09610 [Streptomyces desertarenae]|uniref:Rho termination factor n=1 Tax=Streptomyces desertarenae TaxID=2666184 RepID=A0ABW4PIB0_9ACTN